jgi:hypothetical protein
VVEIVDRSNGGVRGSGGSVSSGSKVCGRSNVGGGSKVCGIVLAIAIFPGSRDDEGSKGDGFAAAGRRAERGGQLY